jgi:hypothetical protein
MSSGSDQMQCVRTNQEHLVSPLLHFVISELTPAKKFRPFEVLGKEKGESVRELNLFGSSILWKNSDIS